MTNDDNNDNIGKSDILSHFVRFLRRNIGDIGLPPPTDYGQPEIGWWLEFFASSCDTIDMIQFLFAYQEWGFLLLRIALGVILVWHGVPKLKNVSATGSWMGSVGFRPGKFFAVFAGLLELLGGAAIILGFLTQIFAALFAVQFLLILLTIKRKAPFKDKEFDILILGASLLLMTGGGTLSLDEYYRIILY